MSDYGTLTTRPVGERGDIYIVLDGDASQLRDWARRPGYSWPCSALARLDHVGVVLDGGNGDLLDLVCDADGHRLDAAEDNLTSDELTAWIDDNLAGTPFAHLARNPVA